MPRTARRILLWVFLVQVLWSGVVAVVMGVVWANSIGEPDVSYACDDGTTCYGGPTVSFILMLVSGGICLVFVTTIVVFTARWRAVAARRTRLVGDAEDMAPALAEPRDTGAEHDRPLA